MPIHVLSRDGQSISGYSDMECWCDLAHAMYVHLKNGTASLDMCVNESDQAISV